MLPRSRWRFGAVACEVAAATISNSLPRRRLLLARQFASAADYKFLQPPDRVQTLASPSPQRSDAGGADPRRDGSVSPVGKRHAAPRDTDAAPAASASSTRTGRLFHESIHRPRSRSTISIRPRRLPARCPRHQFRRRAPLFDMQPHRWWCCRPPTSASKTSVRGDDHRRLVLVLIVAGLFARRISSSYSRPFVDDHAGGERIRAPRHQHRVAPGVSGGRASGARSRQSPHGSSARCRIFGGASRRAPTSCSTEAKPKHNHAKSRRPRRPTVTSPTDPRAGRASSATLARRPRRHCRGHSSRVDRAWARSAICSDSLLDISGSIRVPSNGSPRAPNQYLSISATNHHGGAAKGIELVVRRTSLSVRTTGYCSSASWSTCFRTRYTTPSTGASCWQRRCAAQIRDKVPDKKCRDSDQRPRRRPRGDLPIRPAQKPAARPPQGTTTATRDRRAARPTLMDHRLQLDRPCAKARPSASSCESLGRRTSRAPSRRRTSRGGDPTRGRKPHSAPLGGRPARRIRVRARPPGGGRQRSATAATDAAIRSPDGAGERHRSDCIDAAQTALQNAARPSPTDDPGRRRRPDGARGLATILKAGRWSRRRPGDRLYPKRSAMPIVRISSYATSAGAGCRRRAVLSAIRPNSAATFRPC